MATALQILREKKEGMKVFKFHKFSKANQRLKCFISSRLVLDEVWFLSFSKSVSLQQKYILFVCKDEIIMKGIEEEKEIITSSLPQPLVTSGIYHVPVSSHPPSSRLLFNAIQNFCFLKLLLSI